MRSHRLALIDELNREISEQLKEFNDYLITTSRTLKLLDEVKPFGEDIVSFKEKILEDPFVLFNFKELAWPESAEEWNKLSIPLKEVKYEELNKIQVIAIANNSLLVDEVIPPFILFELSMYEKIGKEEKLRNFFKLNIGRRAKLHTEENKFKILYEMIVEKLQENKQERKLLLTDISFSCIEAIDLNKKERDFILNATQDLLISLKGMNVIPVSISKNNGIPLVASIYKSLENSNKEAISRADLELINDKMFLAGKLGIKERSPILEYRNQILDNPYLKEKCYIFYLRCDVDHIQRVEIPQFALEHVEMIHAILLKEYENSRKRLKKKGFYSFNKAFNNLLTKKMKRKELIELLDMLVKDQMIRNYKKKIGLISNLI